MLSSFTKFSEQILIRKATSEFTGNSDSLYPTLPHLHMGIGGERVQPILKINFSVAECYSLLMEYALQGMAT